MTARTRSALPQRKVAAGAISGAIATLLIAIAAYLNHQPIPEGVTGAIVTLITFCVSYVVPPKAGEIVEEPD